MNDKEVNKIIAEYMGVPETVSINCGDYSQDVLRYVDSLDALVPVWEKLGRYAACGKQEELGFQAIMLPTTVDNMACVYNMESIQQAAAHATAKAILELKQSDNVAK